MILVDSSFFIALLDADDPSHIKAWLKLDGLMDHVGISLLTTRGILNEVLAHFSRGTPRTRIRTAEFVGDILNNPKYEIVTINDEIYVEALNLYRNRPDKRYSMVDCISMTVMQSRNISEVLTTDRDFQQEGFNNLMNP